MAKTLSHVLTSPRGSVGGLTYSANQFAQIIMKTKISPTQPNTNAQTQVRGCLNSASIEWTLMTQAHRDAWEDYAATLNYSGPHGPYPITGRLAFIASYSLAAYADLRGTAAVTLSPAPPVIPGSAVLGLITTAPPTGPGTGIGWSVDSPGAEAMVALIDISPPQNPTRNRYKGPWVDALTFTKAIPAGAAALVELLGLTAGLVYFSRIRAFTSVTPHRITSVTYLRHVAVTLP